MTSTLQQQADELALIGSERRHWMEAMRAKRPAEANLMEARLPTLRDAYATINELAKKDR